VLRTSEISVQFGGVQALDRVGFAADAGMVTGLIGPNGAGKTTMFNVITGLQRPNSGRVWLDEVDVTGSRARARARMGIGRTFQRLEVFGSLSARDNVMVALETRRGLVPRSRRRDQAEELLARVGLSDQATKMAGLLSTGSARLLELARALATKPKVLLLDEVSSGLDSHESVRVGDLMMELAREEMAVLLVEHDMDMVMRVCQQIYVLDFGTLIAAGTPEEIQNNVEVRAAYLGDVGDEGIDVPISGESTP
jgi:branched-chain amino acid transport system ATP-binding protein